MRYATAEAMAGKGAGGGSTGNDGVVKVNVKYSQGNNGIGHGSRHLTETNLTQEVFEESITKTIVKSTQYSTSTAVIN